MMDTTFQAAGLKCSRNGNSWAVSYSTEVVQQGGWFDTVLANDYRPAGYSGEH